MTRLLRDTLEEWAGEARVPHDLADRALRRRAWKPVGALLLAAAMVVAVTFVVSGTRDQVDTVRPATEITLPARPSPAPTDVRTDPANSPPKKLVAAGRMAVSAYYTAGRKQLAKDRQQRTLTWWLYDPRTEGYEQTPYAWVDVAPGLQVAAVLEGDSIGKRVGILDMNTRQILSWIDLEQPVGSVAWSPDGTKILATTYRSSPDIMLGKGENVVSAGDSPRTGYYIVDATTGEAEHHELPPLSDGRGNEKIFAVGDRQDLGWTADGALLWAPTSTDPDRIFYGLDGEPRQAPEGQRYVRGRSISAVSPDGRLVLGPAGLPTKITEVGTGKVVGTQQVMQLHAWADDDNVIALGCEGQCTNEFNAALVLVSVDGTRTTRLTGYKDSRKDGYWGWVLTPR
ncbi:hypothetical protein [Nonomuraea sp. NPDC050643]|uniref:hypothetical protein n=1 Tax=Nonomuraea sp. NPDC050643 TaxID=3155660 RepID=UPI00340305B8